jgi:hypothetical protein
MSVYMDIAVGSGRGDRSWYLEGWVNPVEIYRCYFGLISRLPLGGG